MGGRIIIGASLTEYYLINSLVVSVAFVSSFTERKYTPGGICSCTVVTSFVCT